MLLEEGDIAFSRPESAAGSLEAGSYRTATN